MCVNVCVCVCACVRVSRRPWRRAREIGHGLLDECRVLLVHGLLHLVGFDHEEGEEEAAEMAAYEDELARFIHVHDHVHVHVQSPRPHTHIVICRRRRRRHRHRRRWY